MRPRDRTPPLATAEFIVHFGADLTDDRIMADSEPKRIGLSVEVKPHAYDPAANPELFEGVLARRLLAFVIDLIILAMPVVFLAMFIFVVGVVTFGLGFVFYALLHPGDGALGAVLLRRDAGQPAFGDHRHARHGYRNAHLVRLAGLFRARRRACHRVLDHRFGVHAAGADRLPVQRAPALPARHPDRHRHHQQRTAGQRVAGLVPPRRPDAQRGALALSPRRLSRQHCGQTIGRSARVAPVAIRGPRSAT